VPLPSLVAWRFACRAFSPGLIELGNGITPLAGLLHTTSRRPAVPGDWARFSSVFMRSEEIDF
jgi:hypothetical protein